MTVKAMPNARPVSPLRFRERTRSTGAPVLDLLTLTRSPGPDDHQVAISVVTNVTVVSAVAVVLAGATLTHSEKDNSPRLLSNDIPLSFCLLSPIGRSTVSPSCVPTPPPIAKAGPQCHERTELTTTYQADRAIHR